MSAREEKVALEVAEAEFQTWADSMGLSSKLDASFMDEEDAKSFAAQKRLITDAIRFGDLACNEAGEFVYRPQLVDSSPITFFEPTGNGVMAIDSEKKGQDAHRQFAVLAFVTQQSKARFGNMKNRDVVVLNAILGFFLAR